MILTLVVAALGILLLIMGKIAMGTLITVYSICAIIYNLALFFAEPEQPTEQPEDEELC